MHKNLSTEVLWRDDKERNVCCGGGFDPLRRSILPYTAYPSMTIGGEGEGLPGSVKFASVENRLKAIQILFPTSFALCDLAPVHSLRLMAW